MKKLITVSDWASDSLSCQEFRSAVEGFLLKIENPQINFIASTPSTFHTSFLVNQIVETEERLGKPLKTVIFQNTDPRIQSQRSLKQAEGAQFLIIRLKSGIYLCGPNAGYNFSMIKEKIDEAFIYPGFDKGGQFRSRDLYARVCAHLMEEMEDELQIEEVGVGIIPTLTGFYIGHIDNFGNIKTTICQADFKGKFEYQDLVEVRINNVTKKVKYVNNLFAGSVGELVIYPGSSGKITNRFLEIAIWQHFDEKNFLSAKKEFANPKAGSLIEIKNIK